MHKIVDYFKDIAWLSAIKRHLGFMLGTADADLILAHSKSGQYQFAGTSQGVVNGVGSDPLIADKAPFDKGLFEKGLFDKGLSEKGFSEKGFSEKGLGDKRLSDGRLDTRLVFETQTALFQRDAAQQNGAQQNGAQQAGTQDHAQDHAKDHAKGNGSEIESHKDQPTQFQSNQVQSNQDKSNQDKSNKDKSNSELTKSEQKISKANRQQDAEHQDAEHKALIARILSSETPLTQQSGPIQQGFGRSASAMDRVQWPKFLLKSLFVLVVSLVTWSFIAKIDRVVRGDGSVVPRSHNQTVQHLEGGIMTALYVHEGQLVKAGDVVLRIDDVQAKAMLEDNLVRQESLRLRAARLMVEAGKGASMVLPEGIEEQSPAWKAELESLAMRQSRLTQEEATLRTRLDQREGELQETQERLDSTVLERRIASERLQMIMNLRAQKAVSQLEVLEAQAADARLLSLISATQGALPRITAAIQEVKSQVAELRSRAKAEATSELALVQAELSRIEGTIRSQRDRLERTEVRAPIDGIINHINTNTIGGVVKPGDSLIDITPTAGELLIEARVRPSERGELHPGLPAKIKILAYDYMGLPPLNGEVVEVSADTLSTQQGEKFYRLKVKMDAANEQLKDKSLYPGLSAQVDVVVGRRSIAAYFLSPIAKFNERAFTEAK